MADDKLFPDIALGPTSHIQHWAMLRPEEKAISSSSNSVTWAELESMVYEVQNEIEKLDLTPGSRVLVSADPIAERILTLGVLQAGFQVGSLSRYSDPQSLQSAGFETLISMDGEARGTFPNHLELPLTFGAKVRDWNREPRAFENKDTLRVVFSSGTTGSPKGVPISFETLSKRIIAAKDHYMSLSPYLTTVSFATVAGNTSLFLDVWLGREHLVGGNAAENLKIIETKHVQGLMGSPSSLDMLLRELQPSSDVSSLREIYSAGSFLRPKLAGDLEQSFGARVINLYGSTEAGLVAWNQPTSGETTLEMFPEVECKILAGADEESQDTGLLAIRTPYLASGYLSPSDTENSFIDGYFLPGDIGELNNGKLTLHGRSDDLINLNGEKIDPVPIENYVLENFDAEQAVCVLAQDEEAKKYHLMLIVTEGDLDVEGLRNHLYSIFGTRAPQQVRIVHTIEANEMGKVQRRVSLIRRT